MLTQNFIKLSKAVHKLLCLRRKKLNDDAENNIAVAFFDSNKSSQQ